MKGKREEWTPSSTLCLIARHRLDGCVLIIASLRVENSATTPATINVLMLLANEGDVESRLVKNKAVASGKFDGQDYRYFDREGM